MTVTDYLVTQNYHLQSATCHGTGPEILGSSPTNPFWMGNRIRKVMGLLQGHTAANTSPRMGIQSFLELSPAVLSGTWEEERSE